MNHGMRRTDEMQQKEGWNSMLQFYGNLSSKPSLIPSFLASCKHFDLKDVPPEKDLEATETPHCAYYGNERLMGGRCLLRNNQMAAGAHSRLTQCLPTLITPSCPAVLGLLCHSNDHVPGLETPERTPKGPTFDIWHSWGSDLELASPNVSFKALSSDRGHSGSSWTTTSSMLLDLNLDMGDPPAEDPPAENPPLEDPPDCTLLLSTPGSGTKLPLGLEPKKPSLCLHRSNVIDNKPELPASTSFVDSDSHLRSGHAKSNPSESEKLLNIEDSLSCQGSAVYATFSDTNGNSSTTSGGACSAFDKSAHGSTKETHSPSLTFSDICSTAVNENNVDEGQAMSHNSNWACSTGSTQSVQQWVCNVDAFKSKRGPLRNGSKGEGITDITLQELTQYFSMPITEAAKKLNVGTTVLKKRCREFDIPRWPHRKMKSIDSLITNIMVKGLLTLHFKS
ncbi:hypothetical protein KP509_27G027000 [Ceratopteris richardii]|uniref:RWP-RK domain-containing protein n=1 Tax=Ceratopteris richardii TaxID=49495 RepID=A0A8T2REU3_CERRI|nr:hypothetical protein KP509_27G027000 [Ceratopteris richardii]